MIQIQIIVYDSSPVFRNEKGLLGETGKEDILCSRDVTDEGVKTYLKEQKRDDNKLQIEWQLTVYLN